MPLAPVRRMDAVFEDASHLVLHRAGQGVDHRLPVFRVDEGEDGGEAGFVGVRGNAEDAVDLVRPVDRLPPDIPEPVAGPGDPLGFG